MSTINYFYNLLECDEIIDKSSTSATSKEILAQAKLELRIKISRISFDICLLRCTRKTSHFSESISRQIRWPANEENKPAWYICLYSQACNFFYLWIFSSVNSFSFFLRNYSKLWKWYTYFINLFNAFIHYYNIGEFELEIIWIECATKKSKGLYIFICKQFWVEKINPYLSFLIHLSYFTCQIFRIKIFQD